MVAGVLTALLATALWMGAQIGWMHVRPAENRIRSMTMGYVFSLPLVGLGYAWLPWPAAIGPGAGEESWWVGFIHAYVWHLLLFLCYCECFYHVERAVSLRFLIELLRHPAGVSVEEIRGRYNVRDMISTRLEVLREHHFVECRDGLWRLQPKGLFFARAMQLSAWIFQSEAQYERK